MSLEKPSSPEQAVERIVWSAVRFQGDIFAGQTHGDTMIQLADEIPDYDKRGAEPEAGFITSTGRFVDRIEAGAIAKKAGQLDHLPEREREEKSEYLGAHALKELGPKGLT